MQRCRHQWCSWPRQQRDLRAPGRRCPQRTLQAEVQVAERPEERRIEYPSTALGQGHHRQLAGGFTMSIFTPTASSSFFAGIDLWSVIWSGVYKIEKVARMFGLGRSVNKS